MYGGKTFQEFFMLLMHGERGCHLELFMSECFERNGSAQDGSKTSCKRKPIRTYEERFHTEGKPCSPWVAFCSVNRA